MITMMQVRTPRSDQIAWVFGIASGSGAGFLLSLLTHSPARLELQEALPGAMFGIEADGWLSLPLLMVALLVFPALTILLARRRTFGWPLLPLASFFVWTALNDAHSLPQVVSSLRPMLFGIFLFALLAWAPFSRTVLFAGSQHFLMDDKSCGPRALYLVCRALGMRVTLRQVRRLTKLTARGTTASNLERAAASLGLAVERVPPEHLAWTQARLPAVAFVNWGWGSMDHVIAVLAIKRNKAHIHDPNYAWEKTIPLQRLAEALRYDLLLLHPTSAS